MAAAARAALEAGADAPELRRMVQDWAAAVTKKYTHDWKIDD